MALQEYQEDPGLKRELVRIIKDHRSGATKIALHTLRLLEKTVRKARAESPSIRRRMVRDTMLEITDAHPQMGILHFLRRAIQKTKPLELSVIRDFATEVRQGIDNQQAATAATFAGYVKPGAAVLTLSYSSAVARALIEAQSKNISVVIAESRPKNEGRALARLLHQYNIQVTLVVDAAIGLAVPESDLILLGSDAVTPKYFVNKIGSLAVCQLARRFKIPVEVLTDSYRLTEDRQISRRQINHPAEEIIKRPPFYAINNRYFDFVPLELVNKVICDGRVSSPRRLF